MENTDSLLDVFANTVKKHFDKMYHLLTEINVHPGQQHMLMILEKEDGQSQKEILNKLKVKPATVTVMVQRLEKNGLVRREQDKKDQRITRIFITDKGKEICEKVEEVKERMEEETFKNFTIEEKIIFRRLLLQMQDNLEQEMEEKDKC